MLHSRAAVAGAGPSSSRHVSHQRCRTPARTASAAPMRRSRILTVAAASNQQGVDHQGAPAPFYSSVVSVVASIYGDIVTHVCAGNDQNSSILDAFFVGKALAEV